MGPGWAQQLEDWLEAELRDDRSDAPFRPAVLRWAARSGRASDPRPLLDQLSGIPPSGVGNRRFRWRVPVGGWIPRERLSAWRPAESEEAQRNPDEHAGRLWLPVVMVEHLEWLAEIAEDPDAQLAGQARSMLDEVTPLLEDVVARQVGGLDAWADTFLLWSLVRRPRSLALVRDLVVALATRYAARARRNGGVVLGRRYPFFQQPMTSATAHLATAGVRLGEGAGRLEEAIRYLRAGQQDAGGWADPHQPPDLLTTIAAAEVLGSIDPGFDPSPVVSWIETTVELDRPPALIGPDWPWLAVELLEFRAWADRSFPERFAWPSVATWAMDARVNVPRYEAYLALDRLFAGVEALAAVPVEVAFVDLASFGTWNTAHGQAAGDELLAILTGHLGTLEDERVIRDGGDEFLVLGRPGTDGLEASLGAVFAAWPEVARRALPDLPVVPMRGVLARRPAGTLRETRERLGIAIGQLKHDHPHPAPEGVIRRLD